ncbi:MAG: MBL fold metallo-hydrolase [Candidatus Woesearchaeota archaeon]
MDSKILFLGTGGEITVIGKQIRGSGGIIVKTDECQFHIDPGPGALVRAAMHGINIREHTAILISHEHTAHCAGINSVISAMTLNGLDKHGVLIASESFIKNNQLTEFHKNCIEKIIIANPGKKIGVENIEIHALKTIHNDQSCVGFKIFTPKFILTYTSDTKYDKDIIEQYKKSDILILNIPFPFKTKEPKTLSSDDAVKIINKTTPKLAIINHFGSKMLSASPIYEAREIQKLTKVQVIAAEDGMVIEPTAYSADLKQKTLNLFSKPKK